MDFPLFSKSLCDCVECVDQATYRVLEPWPNPLLFLMETLRELQQSFRKIIEVHPGYSQYIQTINELNVETCQDVCLPQRRFQRYSGATRTIDRGDSEIPATPMRFLSHHEAGWQLVSDFYYSFLCIDNGKYLHQSKIEALSAPLQWKAARLNRPASDYGTGGEVRFPGDRVRVLTRLFAASDFDWQEIKLNMRKEETTYRLQIQENGSGGGRNTAKRGRRSPSEEELEKDEQLITDWKQAKETGVPGCDFAKDKNITVKELATIRDRVYRRKKRSDK